ncbi:sodium:solute symporter [Dysgonomonas sp. ZJ279]|uniref:sodium:solute symporter n=1 Tax=Dysgonomonas sp. ZJ279 TaxID=2709796 RepID=UPI0013E9C4C6|nr:sodium:solute symporter [Dysgonomonas sp. ZJ279]
MGTSILIVIAVYFGVLLLISYLVGRKHTDNDAFFLGNRKSPWYIVAIGMLGDSISGVTFVSVPGMVGQFDMSYMQMVLGFFPGYLIIAFVLLPLYYKLNLTTIYGYLEKRFGFYSYKTGASFFILSRIIGSASKLYLVALILQVLVFDQWNIPFYITVTGIIVLICGYTFRSGIKTIVWTDALQTICLLTALILIIWQVVSRLGLDIPQAIDVIRSSEHSRIFVFDDWASKQNFFKQFLSGILIVIVMTGLDQNMMQKNLSCKNLKDAQKNMVSYGFGFIPMNYLFLALGILLLAFASQYNISLPENSDEILPLLATEYLGLPVLICFAIGIVAASFSNADSALTSLTTSVCVDLLGTEKKNAKTAKRIRNRVHIFVSLLFLVTIFLIDFLGRSNILDTIYKAASYTYGPLLGLFFMGLFTKISLKDKFVPVVCIIAPILCYGLEIALKYQFGYTVGYEILLLNGLLTAFGLWCINQKGVTAIRTT